MSPRCSPVSSFPLTRWRCSSSSSNSLTSCHLIIIPPLARPLAMSSSSSSETMPLLKALSSHDQRAGVPIPPAIAHRGYKALYPENTMLAFRSALAAGAHALETDVHLSGDGEAVLCHDRTLKRCYGVDKPVGECDWSYIKTLKTLKAPHEHMPRLADLLDWLAEPDAGREKIWVLLDIKPDDEPSRLMDAVARAIASAKRLDGVRWEERLTIGCWNTSFLDASLRALPGFPLAHQSYSVSSSTRLLKSQTYPGLSFNILQPALVGPCGARFIKAVRSAPDADRRRIFVWTVNNPFWMRWSVAHAFDGVVTDDPAKYLDVVGRYQQDLVDAVPSGQDVDFSAVREPSGWLSRGKLHLQAVMIQLLVFVLMPFMQRGARRQASTEQDTRVIKT